MAFIVKFGNDVKLVLVKFWHFEVKYQYPEKEWFLKLTRQNPICFNR